MPSLFLVNSTDAAVEDLFTSIYRFVWVFIRFMKNFGWELSRRSGLHLVGEGLWEMAADAFETSSAYEGL
jgi:hypothetical protein